jgi:MGT family glycosyltransferase
MVSRVERAAFRAIGLTRAYEQTERYPDRWHPRIASYLSSPAVAEEIRSTIADERPDLLAVDAMFPAALTQAAQFEGPTAVLCHTCVYRMLDAWRRMLALLVGLRKEAGFGALPDDLDTLWMAHDRLIVTTPAALDAAPSGLAHPERVRHVGPVLEKEGHAVRVALPWPEDDERPLVLVSFSTMPEQAAVEKFRNTIEALARLPVGAVVTTGDSLDPAVLQSPPNVAVFANADHDALMCRASAVVTHGGHGTMMRALGYGLPMVVMPGLASDQPVNAAWIEAQGAGRGLPGDATADMVRDAIADILDTASYRTAARALSQTIKGLDGAQGAADEIEQLLGTRQAMAS